MYLHVWDNISQYMIIPCFLFALFYVSNSDLFLQSTPVLLFSIDVGLVLFYDPICGLK